jgi:L-alanine-DL-glutamate epimerase-like enolase superfamily enzyme
MSISRSEFFKFIGLGMLAAPWGGGEGLSARGMAKLGEEARRLKVNDVEIFAFDVPLREPFRIAIGTMTAANDVLVRIHTDGGIVGIGEACPFPPITGETQQTNLAMAVSIRDIVRGKDPLAIEGILAEIGPMVHSNPSIVAAYDMALFDILGKVAGLPLFRLLGGSNPSFETDITVGLDAPERMAERAKAFVGQGYKVIKVKVGQDPDLDVARMQAVRSAVGEETSLRIDANQGWTVPQAVSALRRMERFRIQFCEQPVAAWDVSGLRAVREGSPIAVMADEAVYLPADAIKLVKADACDHFNIKLMKAGGLMNGLKIAHVAEAANIRCMVGCMLESKVALTAAAHLVASERAITFADLDGNSEHTVDPVVDGMTVSKGVITLPEKPGLGCDVDSAFLKKLRKI